MHTTMAGPIYVSCVVALSTLHVEGRALGEIGALVELLRDSGKSKNAALALGDRVIYNAEATTAAIAAGALDPLFALYVNGSAPASECAAVALRNLAMGGAAQIVFGGISRIAGLIAEQAQPIGDVSARLMAGISRSSTSMGMSKHKRAPQHGRAALTQASSRGNAVLAVAAGYPWPVAARFLGSLRRSGFNEAIYLLTGANEESGTLRVMQRFGAIRRRLPATGWDRVQARTLAAMLCVNGSHRLCLISDFRDVYFQRPPFERYPPGVELLIPHEANSLIGSNLQNGLWMRQCLRTEQLPEELGARRSVCSGTLMGSARGLMALARQMNETTRDLPTCRAGPLDQVMIVHDLPWPTTDRTFH